MSTAISTALYARLAGLETLYGRQTTAQAALASLLATDPTTGKPSIHFTSLADMIASNPNDFLTRFPCLTIYPDAGMPALTSPDAIVEASVYNIEIWSVAEDDKPITDSQENLEMLLDNRRGAPTLVLSTGFCFAMYQMTSARIIPNPRIHGRGGLTRWQFIEARV